MSGLKKFFDFGVSRFDRLALTVSDFTRRRPDDQKNEINVRLMQMCLVVLFAFSVIAIASWSAFSEFEARSQVDADLILPTNDWVAIYGESGECLDSGKVSPSCPAHPDSLLWKSPSRRNEPDSSKFAKNHIENVAQQKGKTFWIGTVIQKEILQRAAKKEANWLVLGWITGTFSIYIDGQEIMRGVAAENRLSAHFPVPIERLSEDRPLYLAIKIVHDAGAKYPDILARGEERFATSGQAFAWERVQVTLVESRPLALGILNFVIAILFFFLWYRSSNRREFGYMCIYVLIHACVQLTLVDVVYKLLGRNIVHSTDIILRTFEGGFGLILALSYGRVRATLIQIVTIYLFFLGVALSAVALLINDATPVNATIGVFFVPLCYLFGGFYCLLTSRALITAPTAQKVPHRVNRLVAAGACFIAMALLYHLQAQSIQAPLFIASHRVLHVSLIITIIFLLLLDVAEQERIIAGIPISRWHVQVPMPQSLNVVLTKADIKGSQSIVDDFGDTVYDLATDAWYTTLGEEVVRRDGEITFDEGDCLIGVCENEIYGKSCDLLIIAHAAAYLRIVEVAERLGIKPISYRAAIAAGTLKPKWKNMLGIRRPAFSGSVLVEVAGLMDCERSMTENPHASRLVISMDLIEDGHISSKILDIIEWEIYDQIIADKRGNPRRIAVWNINREQALLIFNEAKPDHQKINLAS